MNVPVYRLCDAGSPPGCDTYSTGGTPWAPVTPGGSGAGWRISIQVYTGALDPKIQHGDMSIFLN